MFYQPDGAQAIYTAVKLTKWEKDVIKTDIEVNVISSSFCNALNTKVLHKNQFHVNLLNGNIHQIQGGQ